jgi:hypothetical protein
MTAVEPPEGVEAPSDVRVVFSDGREVTCDVVYLGEDEDGIHRWEARLNLIAPGPTEKAPLVRELRCAKLPGKTSLVLALAWLT